MGNIIENKNSTFPAIVAKVLNEYEVIINKGSMHQIKEGQRFLIYRISDEEIIDPETQQSLGYLEIVVGRGKVTHVQERKETRNAGDSHSESTLVPWGRCPDCGGVPRRRGGCSTCLNVHAGGGGQQRHICHR
jgi:hypothetical protein